MEVAASIVRNVSKEELIIIPSGIEVEQFIYQDEKRTDAQAMEPVSRRCGMRSTKKKTRYRKDAISHRFLPAASLGPEPGNGSISKE